MTLLGWEDTLSRAQQQMETSRISPAVGEHLAWAHKVIHEPICSGDRIRFTAELDSVSARAVDPNLYLAVFGEFSSGKTSVLNALPGRVSDSMRRTTSASVDEALTKTEREATRAVENALTPSGPNSARSSAECRRCTGSASRSRSRTFFGRGNRRATAP